MIYGLCILQIMMENLTKFGLEKISFQNNTSTYVPTSSSFFDRDLTSLTPHVGRII
jgi:hypothetical protein